MRIHYNFLLLIKERTAAQAVRENLSFQLEDKTRGPWELDQMLEPLGMNSRCLWAPLYAAHRGETEQSKGSENCTAPEMLLKTQDKL